MIENLPRLAPRAGRLAVATVSLGCLLLSNVGLAQNPPAPKPLPAPAAAKDNAKDNAKTEDVEVLTRGPLHEAFAEQIAKDPKPGIVAAKKPPADVNEIPPEFKPEGKNVTWIPGYWFWDEERKDYIWISGVWRSIPPSRRWVPGYWQKADKGHQWVSGFWAPAAARELEYRDTPPKSLDGGPTTAAPSEEHFWIPGSWNYAEDEYRWRPGHWHPYQEDWAWVPEHYVWTPQGCIYVSGYWDYNLAGRGQCYAPIYFRNGIYANAGYRYRPSYLLGGAGLLMHLFVHPHHGHYYFGDYYGSHYAGLHFYHAHHYHGHHRGYDPLYTYYRAHYRHHGIDYHSRMRSWNDHFTKHRDRRPPRTYAGQRQYLDRHKGRGGGRSDHLVLGRSMRDAIDKPRSSDRFRRVAASGTQEADREIRHSRDLGNKRRSSEGQRTTSGPRTGRDEKVAERRRLSLPPASTPAATAGRSRGPRPADRSRDVVRSGDARRPESSRGARSGSDQPRSAKPNRASAARRYESRGDSSRARTSSAAREAFRRSQETRSGRSSRSSSSRSARPSRPSGSSSGRSVAPSRSSSRPSARPSRSSRSSSRPSSRSSRASSSPRRSSSGAGRPSRSSSSGRARSSSGSRRSSSSRSSSSRSSSSRSSRGKR